MARVTATHIRKFQPGRAPNCQLLLVGWCHTMQAVSGCMPLEPFVKGHTMSMCHAPMDLSAHCCVKGIGWKACQVLWTRDTFHRAPHIQQCAHRGRAVRGLGFS